jgi:predicted RNase H-like HicB family nuclease
MVGCSGWAEAEQMRYAIVIERGTTGYGAYVPDLPGCAVVGETEQEVRQLIQEAIELHVDGMRKEGLKVPSPSSSVDYVEVPPAA